MPAENEGRRIKSVDRTFQILQEIGERDRVSVSELAESVDLSPGTVHTHLATLKHNGFVEQEGNEYRLGMEFIPFGERVRNQTDLYQAGRSEVDALAYRHDAVAHLATEYDGRLLVLHETFGKDAVGKNVHTRKRNQPQNHMHCTAAGKAILAHLPEQRVDEIIHQEGLPAYTSHTLTDEATLYEELTQIRDRNYAVNNEEVVHGNRGIGAPVVHEDGEIIGAISVSGPANSWQDERFEDELAEAVIRSANNIEISIYTETAPL